MIKYYISSRTSYLSFDGSPLSSFSGLNTLYFTSFLFYRFKDTVFHSRITSNIGSSISELKYIHPPIYRMMSNNTEIIVFSVGDIIDTIFSMYNIYIQ